MRWTVVSHIEATSFSDVYDPPLHPPPPHGGSQLQGALRPHRGSHLNVSFTSHDGLNPRRRRDVAADVAKAPYRGVKKPYKALRGTPTRDYLSDEEIQECRTKKKETMSKEQIERCQKFLREDKSQQEEKDANAKQRYTMNTPEPMPGDLSQADLRSQQFEDTQGRNLKKTKKQQTAALDSEAALDRMLQDVRRLAELEDATGAGAFKRLPMASAEEERPGESGMQFDDPMHERLMATDPSVSPPPIDIPDGVPERCRPGSEVLVDLSRETHAPRGVLIRIKPPLVSIEPPAPIEELPDLHEKNGIASGPSADAESLSEGVQEEKGGGSFFSGLFSFEMPPIAIYVATLGPRHVPGMQIASHRGPANGTEHMASRARGQPLHTQRQGIRQNRRSTCRELARDFL